MASRRSCSTVSSKKGNVHKLVKENSTKILSKRTQNAATLQWKTGKLHCTIQEIMACQNTQGYGNNLIVTAEAEGARPQTVTSGTPSDYTCPVCNRGFQARIGLIRHQGTNKYINKCTVQKSGLFEQERQPLSLCINYIYVTVCINVFIHLWTHTSHAVFLSVCRMMIVSIFGSIKKKRSVNTHFYEYLLQSVS